MTTEVEEASRKWHRRVGSIAPCNYSKSGSKRCARQNACGADEPTLLVVYRLGESGKDVSPEEGNGEGKSRHSDPNPLAPCTGEKNADTKVTEIHAATDAFSRSSDFTGTVRDPWSVGEGKTSHLWASRRFASPLRRVYAKESGSFPSSNSHYMLPRSSQGHVVPMSRHSSE